MVGEVKWWRTQRANWRIERVVGSSGWLVREGGRRWEVTGWRVDAEEETIDLGRWVTWKAAVEAIVRREEQWEIEARAMNGQESKGVDDGR